MTQSKNDLLDELFCGRKSKWLPLYRRLLARFNDVPGVDFYPLKNLIAIGHTDDARATLGAIHVTQKGLDIGLGLAKAFMKTDRLKLSQRSPKWITHRVLIAKANEIDDEFLTWIKAARHQARIARPRST